MNFPWWLTTLTAITAGVASNFLTSAIRALIAQRSVRSQAKATERIKNQYLAALFYAAHPDFLTMFMVLQVLVMVSLGGLLYAVQIGEDLLPHAVANHPIPSLHGAVPILVTFMSYSGLIVLIVFLIKLPQDAWNLYSRVTNLEKYLETVPAELRDGSLENRVRAALKARE